VARVLPLGLVAALGLAACAGPGGLAARRTLLLQGDLGERLAARGGEHLGAARPFQVGAERFEPDCIGFVEAVYAAEGVPLRRLMRETVPRATSGVAAAFRTVERYGFLFGGGGAWPEPGDLVFFHDTFDRDRNGDADDGLTHVGLVESVAHGTVTFLHLGGRGVARARLNLEHPDAARAPDGAELNSHLRVKTRGARPEIPLLASQLFAGYGRLEPARLRAALAAP
jgi:probable lipoprotein NlpC